MYYALQPGLELAHHLLCTVGYPLQILSGCDIYRCSALWVLELAQHHCAANRVVVVRAKAAVHRVRVDLDKAHGVMWQDSEESLLQGRPAPIQCRLYIHTFV